MYQKDKKNQQKIW